MIQGYSVAMMHWQYCRVVAMESWSNGNGQAGHQEKGS